MIVSTYLSWGLLTNPPIEGSFNAEREPWQGSQKFPPWRADSVKRAERPGPSARHGAHSGHQLPR